MVINDDSFANTHCDVCGRLNEDESNYTCPDCVKEQEARQEDSRWKTDIELMDYFGKKGWTFNGKKLQLMVAAYNLGYHDASQELNDE